MQRSIWTQTLRVKWLLSLFLASPLFAADTVDDVLNRYLDAAKQNATRAQQYAFSEKETVFNFDSPGTPKPGRSRTWDVLFVEGKPYPKLVAQNDQPLNERDAAKEEERLQSPIDRHTASLIR